MIHDFILNILQWLYDTVAYHNLFFAIILLTLVVRIVLLPFFYKSSKDQLILKKITPELERIKQVHKEDKERQMKELMSMYKKHKLNPFSGILVLIVQLPIFFVLFRIFRDSALLTSLFDGGNMFLGANLTQPSIVISVIAAAVQFISGKMMLTTGDKKSPAQRWSSMMLYMMPGFTLLILMKLPAALGVYWTASTCFSIAQTLVIKRKLAYSDTSNGDEGTAKRTDGTHQIDGV